MEGGPLTTIPFIRKNLLEQILAKINGEYLCVMFDGTCRDGEVVAILVRFIQDWNVQQFLVKVKFVEKSMDGQQLAGLLAKHYWGISNMASTWWAVGLVMGHPSIQRPQRC